MATTNCTLKNVPRYVYYLAGRFANEWIAAGEHEILAHSESEAEVIAAADATGLPYILIEMGSFCTTPSGEETIQDARKRRDAITIIIVSALLLIGTALMAIWMSHLPAGSA